MEKKPKVFANEINRNIRNNKEVFDSSKEVLISEKNSLDIDIQENEVSVVDKINNLLNRNGYIFNVPVLIITNDKEYKTHIASVVNNHIITLDNDLINIDSVIDIKY